MYKILKENILRHKGKQMTANVGKDIWEKKDHFLKKYFPTSHHYIL